MIPGAIAHSAEAAPQAAALEAIYAFGFDMVAKERWSEALDVFRAMLLAGPNDDRGWLGVGRCHEELGQGAVALELYSLGLLALPRTVRVRVALARLLKKQGGDDHAEHLLEAAEEIAASLDDEELVELVARAKRES